MFLTAEGSFGRDREAFDAILAGVRGAGFFAEGLFFAGFLSFSLCVRGLALRAMHAFPSIDRFSYTHLHGGPIICIFDKKVQRIGDLNAPPPCPRLCIGPHSAQPPTIVRRSPSWL